MNIEGSSKKWENLIQRLRPDWLDIRVIYAPAIRAQDGSQSISNVPIGGAKIEAIDEFYRPIVEQIDFLDLLLAMQERIEELEKRLDAALE